MPVLVLFTVNFFLYGAWFLKPLEVIERTYNTIYFFPTVFGGGGGGVGVLALFEVGLGDARADRV